MKRLRNYFITGLVTLLPLVVTIIILVYVFQKLDAFLSQLVPPIISTFIPPSIIEKAGGLISIGIKIAALLIVLGLITLFGFFTSRVVGRRILDFLERKIFFKIPLISTIYRPIKEINNVLFTGKKYVFKRVVMLEYPRRGVYSIGFVTAETPLETPGEGGQSKQGTQSRQGSPQKILSIFIPTTPNPTSGYLTLVAEKETVPLSIGIQKAFQLIISGGALAPSYKDELNKAFERKLGRR